MSITRAEADPTSGAGLAAAVATLAPVLLAFNLPPSPTFLNQALAIGLWGTCIALLASTATPDQLRDAFRNSSALMAALLMLGLCVIAPVLRTHLPPPIALSILAALACALLVAWCGASVAIQRGPTTVFTGFILGVAGAGGVERADRAGPGLCARLARVVTSSRARLSPGRAVGNLRQPNHLASLLLWSAIAAVGLLELKGASADRPASGSVHC